MDISGITSGMIRRIQLPTDISLKALDKFLTDEKTISYLLRLKNGFSFALQHNQTVKGDLNTDASNAEEELKIHVTEKLGQPEKAILEIN